MYHAATGGLVFALTDESAALSAQDGAIPGCQALIESIAAGLEREHGHIDWSRTTHPTAPSLVGGMLRPSATGYHIWFTGYVDEAVFVLRDGVFDRALNGGGPEEKLPSDHRHTGGDGGEKGTDRAR